MSHIHVVLPSENGLLPLNEDVFLQRKEIFEDNPLCAIFFFLMTNVLTICCFLHGPILNISMYMPLNRAVLFLGSGDPLLGSRCFPRTLYPFNGWVFVISCLGCFKIKALHCWNVHIKESGMSTKADCFKIPLHSMYKY